MCDEARHRSSFVNSTDVLVHSAKYLDRESHLFTEDGLHIFSLSDSVPMNGMVHIFNAIKESPSYEFLHSLDASFYSPYHYAATYHLDDVFHHITKSRVDRSLSKKVDHNIVRSLCLYSHPETKHTVPSILIEKDRMPILASCLSEALHIDPFDSEFEDIYLTWLHECIMSDAKSTANYLQRCHKRGMTHSLKRGGDVSPREHLSPMDIVLTTPHKNQMYYIDIILKDFVGGYKLVSTNIDMLLGRLNHIQKMTSGSLASFIEKCLFDTVSHTIIK
jgi:hypothetical protein